jgi:hypothetical protein
MDIAGPWAFGLQGGRSLCGREAPESFLQWLEEGRVTGGSSFFIHFNALYSLSLSLSHTHTHAY